MSTTRPIDDEARVRSYVAHNGGDTAGYRDPDGTLFRFSLWNARLVGITPRQRRRLHKKHLRAIHRPSYRWEIPF